MDATANLALPYIIAAQAQKHVTHNEAIRALDVLVQMSVLDRNLTVAPGSPGDGDRYIVEAGATGLWAGKDGQIAAYQDNAWVFHAPRDGWLAWIADEQSLFVHEGANWSPVSTGSGGGGGGSVNPTPLVGVNTTADTTNRLAVSSPASLFNHDGAGHQQKINKSAVGDSASQLYQTGFSGRAEIGLTGDDDFHFKVSDDGTNWIDALTIDSASGLAVVDGDPVAALGIATKQYVDSSSGGPAATIAFDYQTAINQTLTASGSWQKLTGFTTGRISHADFSTANSRFTAATAGSYLFLGQIVQAPGGAGNQFGAFGKNGAPVGNWIIHGVTTAVQDFMLVSSILNLAVGDYVEFFAFAQVNTTINLGFTSFGGHLI